MISLVQLYNEIKINQPGKIKDTYKPDWSSDLDNSEVYELDLNTNSVVAYGEYVSESDLVEVYISRWGAGKIVVDFFKKRKIDFTFRVDQHDDKYGFLIIKNAKKYFEFNK